MLLDGCGLRENPLVSTLSVYTSGLKVTPNGLYSYSGLGPRGGHPMPRWDSSGVLGPWRGSWAKFVKHTPDGVNGAPHGVTEAPKRSVCP